MAETNEAVEIDHDITSEATQKAAKFVMPEDMLIANVGVVEFGLYNTF